MLSTHHSKIELIIKISARYSSLLQKIELIVPLETILENTWLLRGGQQRWFDGLLPIHYADSTDRRTLHDGQSARPGKFARPCKCFGAFAHTRKSLFELFMDQFLQIQNPRRFDISVLFVWSRPPKKATRFFKRRRNLHALPVNARRSTEGFE